MMQAHEDIAIRDERGAIAADFLERTAAALEAGDARAVRALTRDLHAADLADLIEAWSSRTGCALITALGRGFDVEALAELDETARDRTDGGLPNEVIASAVKKLDTDDALYLIEDLEEAEQQDILAKVPSEDRAALSRGLDYPENTAGRLMQTEFVAVPAFWSVGKTIDYMRVEKDLPEQFVEIYVVDPAYHLIGVVPLAASAAQSARPQDRRHHGRRTDGVQSDRRAGRDRLQVRAIQPGVGGGDRRMRAASSAC